MEGHEIRKQLEEARTARARLFTEVDNLKAREAVDGTSDGLNERLGNLNRGIENADSRIAELEAEFGRDMLDGMRAGRYAVEEGAVRTTYGHPDAAIAREKVREAYRQAPAAPVPLHLAIPHA